MNPLNRLSEYLGVIERRLRWLTLTRGAAVTAAAALALTVVAVLAANYFAFSNGSVLGARVFLFLGLAFALAAALIVLVDLNRLNAVIAVIIIGREIAISALREWMALLGAAKGVAVSFIGKIKTVAQMVAVPMLLYHDAIGVFRPQQWGTGLILLAAALTLWSMFYYLKMAMPTVLKHG